MVTLLQTSLLSRADQPSVVHSAKAVLSDSENEEEEDEEASLPACRGASVKVASRRRPALGWDRIPGGREREEQKEKDEEEEDQVGLTMFLKGLSRATLSMSSIATCLLEASLSEFLPSFLEFHLHGLSLSLFLLFFPSRPYLGSSLSLAFFQSRLVASHACI